MNNTTHAVDQEELMAYLDGELLPERALAVAAHLKECAECAAAVADLRRVSAQLANWEIEASPEHFAERVAAAVKLRAQARNSRQGRQMLYGAPGPSRGFIPRWVWAAVGTAAVVLLLVSISIPNLLRSRMASQRAGEGIVTPINKAVLPEYGDERPIRTDLSQLTAPMIVRTASLTLIADDFDKARPAIEDTVRKYQGYIAELTVRGRAGTGRAITATIRVPANQLDAAVADLKKLGRAEQESQRGEEVTQQYVDLSARLSNARHTEQRLVDILLRNTGRVADVLAVEREIARVREEIERMQAQLQDLDKRVRFATVELRVTEEYQAPLQAAPTATRTRLRNALVEGYRDLVENALGLVLFLLSYGPTLFFWALILFWPARWVWRRWRARTAQTRSV